jgi:hypothetical protein
MTEPSDQLTLAPIDAAAREPQAARSALSSPPVPVAPPITPRTFRDWFVDEVLLPIFRPRIARLSVWRWADANVTLHAAGTGKGGRYRSSFTPWTRRFQDVFIDPEIREAHELKSSRVGMTEAGFNVIRYMPEHKPGPAHFAITSQQKAIDANKDRILPTLRRVFASEDTDPDDITGRIVRLRNMVIRVTGSARESAFRGEGSMLELVDEVEENGSIAGAGTLHNLARSRVTGVDGAKVMTLSKAREWSSPHHVEVASGTLEAFLVPCPHCGTFQELSFDGTSPTEFIQIKKASRPIAIRLGKVKFDQCRLLDGSWDLERVQRETVYECVSGCIIDQEAPLTLAQREVFAAAAALDGSPLYAGTGSTPARPRHRLDGFSGAAEVVRRLDAGIRTTTKWAMTNAGQWLRTNPRPHPFKVTQHISDLYSLHDDMTWGDLGRIFLERKSQPDGLRFFHNNHVGIPHRERAADVSEEQLHECLVPYARGTAPFVPDIVVAGFDTQDAYWKFVIAVARLDSARRGWRDIAVVHWGYAMIKDDVLAQIAVPIPLASDPSRTFQVTAGLIDAGGHRTDEVYELHYDTHRVLFPSYGRGDKHAELRPTWARPLSEGWRGLTFNICYYWDDFWKKKLYLGSIREVRKIREIIDQRGLDPAAFNLPPRLWLPGAPRSGPPPVATAGVDAKETPLSELLSELQGERLNDAGEWVNVDGHRNDFGDALKECYATLDFRLAAVAAGKADAEAAAAKKAATPDSKPL